MNRTAIYSAVIFLSFGLAGCGGGSGGGGGFTFAPGPSAETPEAPPPAASSTTVSGTAAVGAPVANANVTVHCANGVAASATTTDAGRWTASLAEPVFPCLITVSGGSLPAGTSLHSLAVGEGHVNVTPLTDLVLAKAAQADPSTLENANAGTLAALAQKLADAQAQVLAILEAAGYPGTTLDLFAADFEPAKGDAYDDLLEQLAISLADGSTSYGELLQTVASSGSSTELPALPLTTTFTQAELSAMPQLNRASLATAGGVLTMKLEDTSTSPNPVGAFVGGGTGNKAVLQLPGVAGLKLKDLQKIEIELKGDAGVTAPPILPYVSVNLTVDLTCNLAPLAEGAMLSDAQARRRILSFDPYYHFISGTPALSDTEFRTMTVEPTTPGWRISGGVPVGTVAITPNYNGSETLEGFDYDTYPDACIVDAATGDNGMYRDASCVSPAALLPGASASCGMPYSGALLFLGSSGATQASEWSIRQVSLYGTRKQTFRFE